MCSSALSEAGVHFYLIDFNARKSLIRRKEKRNCKILLINIKHALIIYKQSLWVLFHFYFCYTFVKLFFFRRAYLNASLSPLLCTEFPVSRLAKNNIVCLDTSSRRQRKRFHLPSEWPFKRLFQVKVSMVTFRGRFGKVKSVNGVQFVKLLPVDENRHLTATQLIKNHF
jgi:hypothetical protein